MYEYVYMYLSLENLHIYMNFHGYGQINHRFRDVGFAFPLYVYYKEGKSRQSKFYYWGMIFLNSNVIFLVFRKRFQDDSLDLRKQIYY